MDRYIISLDLDGTLLKDDKSISEYTLNILDKCQKIGCRILINTSRSCARTLEYATLIKADYVACFNGNYVYSNDKIFVNNIIEKATIKEILNLIQSKNISIIIETLDGAYRNDINEWDLIKSKYMDISDMFEKKIYKVIIKSNNIQYFDSIIKKHNIQLEYDSVNNIYRLLPINSNKNNAIDIISNHLNKKYKTISFGDDISDYECLINSDIGIAMKNSSQVLDNILLKTQSNDDDGVAKFLDNMFNFNIYNQYNCIKILDCTLRDGGHLNYSNFGYDNIKKIISNLVNANLDIVEIGFLEDCVYNKDIARFPTVEDAEKLVEHIDLNHTQISLLTQVDKFNINNLTKCEGKIKIIRVSFHKHLIEKAIEYVKIVKEKGYICTFNPINFSGYSNYEIIKLLEIVNTLNIDYFTIVDTFGILTHKSFVNQLKLITRLLRKDISLGLHLHDNLSSSFSTAQIIMDEIGSDKNIIIDSSLNGMGRSPGNLKTELITYYINNFKKRYDMNYIYDSLEEIIYNLKQSLNWGIDFSYSISAFNHAHRSYAEYLLNKKLRLKDIDVIIKLIPSNKKDRYDEKLIEKLYSDYMMGV